MYIIYIYIYLTYKYILCLCVCIFLLWSKKSRTYHFIYKLIRCGASGRRARGCSLHPFAKCVRRNPSGSPTQCRKFFLKHCLWDHSITHLQSIGNLWSTALGQSAQLQLNCERPTASNQNQRQQRKFCDNTRQKGDIYDYVLNLWNWLSTILHHGF